MCKPSTYQLINQREGRKEMFYQHILFTVIWRQTYGIGPFR